MDNDKLLIEVYKAFYGPNITLANLNDLARDLSQVARRSRPWTGKFLHSLIKGYAGFSTNQELIAALHILVDRLEGSDEIQRRAKEATILTVNDLPEGTIVLGPARRCATPGCRVFFVPVHPRQKYHSRNCAALSKRHKQAKIGKKLNSQLTIT
jgi:hypothetical protein